MAAPKLPGRAGIVDERLQVCLCVCVCVVRGRCVTTLQSWHTPAPDHP